jgi:hypothetical protein
MQPSPEFQIRFLQNIQRVLKEGSFSSTYKFALLHSIADVCVERGLDDDSLLPITTQELAIKFIDLYWSQSSKFPNKSEHDVLFQNNGKQAGIINYINELRSFDTRLSAIKSHQNYEKLIKEVARVIQIMPLWKLQTVGDMTNAFLYPQVGKGSAITLNEGVSYCFRKFYGHVIDMLHSSWIRWIQKASKNQIILGQNVNLEAFLFESKRSSLKPYVSVLREEQSNYCFYCDKQMIGEPEVDHFIPWSRYSVDLGHNFVLAHKACNGDKSDYLASKLFLSKWEHRNNESGEMLIEYFDDNQLNYDLGTSIAVANWAYKQCSDMNGSLWQGYKQGLMQL